MLRERSRSTSCERRPRRLGVERRVEKFLRSTPNTDFPSRGSRCCAPARGCPRVARRRRRCVIAHGDLARDRAAAADALRVSVARQVPAAGVATSANQKYGGPPWRVVRFGGDAAVGCDQRKFAIERLFRREDDAQRRALPWRERRRQHRDPCRVIAAAGQKSGFCGRSRGQQDKQRGNYRQICRSRGNSKPAC